jgi:hypothetical protein
VRHGRQHSDDVAILQWLHLESHNLGCAHRVRLARTNEAWTRTNHDGDAERVGFHTGLFQCLKLQLTKFNNCWLGTRVDLRGPRVGRPERLRTQWRALLSV